MEGGIFTSPIARLTTLIHANTDLRTLPHLLAHANALGLPVRSEFSTERVLFTVAQAVANLLDEMVPAEGNLRRRRLEGGLIEGYSTLNSVPSCLAGNLHIAALLFSSFCPRMSMWNILDELTRVREDLNQQEAILEEVRLQNRIHHLPNLRSAFTCHCLIFTDQLPRPPSIRCAECGGEYHTECQCCPLMCNSCFLRFCIFDLREQLADPFSRGKEVELVYFSYLENVPPQTMYQDHDIIYFQIIRFDLPQLTNVEKLQKAFYLKLALVNRIFGGELQAVGGRRRQVRESWDVECIEYCFFLNHNEIRITSRLSDYAVIFKLLSRQLFPLNNILVIKCTKRNYLCLPQQPTPYWAPNDHSTGPTVLMMGIYQTNKVKPNSKIYKWPKQGKNMVGEVNMGQSLIFLEYVLLRINKIQSQIVDLIDATSGIKIINPVRSFTCTHLQCFDYQTYKHSLKPKNKKQKPIQKLAIDVDLEPSKDVIDLDSTSPVVVPTQTSSNHLPTVQMGALQRRKEYVKRRRQKERREKREKEILFCPICSKRMVALYTDPLFKTILLNSGFYTRAKVFSSGQFIFESPK